ncbi:MAG: ACP S-malonyltransferase, partial [Porticoccaceae bacterium]|nr:ACP S-malonyltransferase [Porticoccaceae bacterium]
MGKLGFVFPGQGSQKIGMLSDYVDEPVVLDCFAEASDCLGYDVWDMIQQGNQETITQTQRTQPILLCCSVAIWRLWCHRGGAEPQFLAGHSLGEWSALVCAEVVAFKDAIKIVEARGKLMQSAVPAGEGAMAAILGLADDQI